MRSLVFLVVLSGPVVAFEPRADDTVLDAAAMHEAVIGRTHEFHDGGLSFFSISGSYTYTYPGGGIAHGDWKMPNGGADGVICTHFRHGFERCDLYVRNDGRLLLIDGKGRRFPVRDPDVRN